MKHADTKVGHYHGYLIAFFLFLEFLIIIRNLGVKDYLSLFWLCNIVPLILAVFFLLRQHQWIKAVINIMLIVQFYAFASLCAAVFLGADIGTFPGIAEYSAFEILVSFLIHLLPVNIALLFTYQVRPRWISLLYSTAILLVVFVIGHVFFPGHLDINYLGNADFLNMTLPLYSQLWVVWLFIGLVLPTYLLQVFIYRVTR